MRSSRLPEYRVRERLYLTRDGRRVVPQSNPDACTLYAGTGTVISGADALRLGLITGEPGEGAAEDHAVRTPAPDRAPQTKVITPARRGQAR